MHPDSARIQVNGEIRSIVATSSVQDFVTTLGIPENAVVVELNGVALFRREWPDRALCHGDRLEIISIVAGG